LIVGAGREKKPKRQITQILLALEEAEALGEMDAVEDWRELRKKSPEAIKEFLRRRYEHWNAPEKHEVKEEIGNVEDLINARVAKYIAIRSRTGTEGKPVSGNSPGKSVDQRRTNDKAELFLKTEAREALFGGAAGGGKSYCLTMAALQYVDVPYYNALLVRRTYGHLSQPGALMDIMRQWLEGSGRGVHWDRVENLITFPSGAQLKFGYLRNEADKDQYQGANFHFIGVDELTQFDEDQYLWLMSRNRAPISESDIPLRMWSASNPGRRGHYWVKQRFLIEGELKAGHSCAHFAG